MSKPIKKLKHQTGFSLIEVLVVISILVTITAIAAPNVTSSMAKQKMKSEATAIASLLQQAKIESAIQRKTTTVTITPAKIDVTDAAGRILTSHTFPDNITFSLVPQNTTSVEFSPSGYINALGGTNTGVVNTSLIFCHDSISNETPRTVEISTNMRVSYSKAGSCT